MSDLELRVLFRDSAWRWRLGATDEVELWTGTKCLGSIPGSMMTDILRDYLNKLAILHHFQAKLDEARATPPPSEGPSPQLRRDRREARRKPLKKALILLLAVACGFVLGLGTHHLLITPTSERANAYEMEGP